MLVIQLWCYWSAGLINLHINTMVSTLDKLSVSCFVLSNSSDIIRANHMLNTTEELMARWSLGLIAWSLIGSFIEIEICVSVKSLLIFTPETDVQHRVNKYRVDSWQQSLKIVTKLSLTWHKTWLQSERWFRSSFNCKQAVRRLSSGVSQLRLNVFNLSVV